MAHVNIIAQLHFTRNHEIGASIKKYIFIESLCITALLFNLFCNKCLIKNLRGKFTKGCLPCYLTETSLAAVLAVAKLAGGQRRMRNRQKTHPPPFYINSTGSRQHSLATSEDELPSNEAHTGSTNKQTNFQK